MRVRLRDANGNLLPAARADNVQWRVNDLQVTVTPATGDSVDVLVASSSTTPTTLTASIDGKSDAVTLTPLTAPGSAVDRIRGPYAAQARPMIALAEGQPPNGKPWQQFVAFKFVQEGLLNEFVGGCPSGGVTNCGYITVFSQNHALARTPVRWTSGCDLVDLAVNAPSTCAVVPAAFDAPKLVNVNSWNLASGADVSADLKADLAYTEHVLREGWSGLRLAQTINAGNSSVRLPITVNSDWSCGSEVRDQLELAGVNGFGKTTITVVYVDDLTESVTDPQQNPVSLRGYTCRWNDSDGIIILVNSSGRGHTTLAHEFGHALGPWWSDPWGHVDFEPGFNSSNLMWAYQADDVPASRGLLTLGQTFRMELGDDAFVTRQALEGGIMCGKNAADAPCPRLSQDVRTP